MNSSSLVYNVLEIKSKLILQEICEMTKIITKAKITTFLLFCFCSRYYSENNKESKVFRVVFLMNENDR